MGALIPARRLFGEHPHEHRHFPDRFPRFTRFTFPSFRLQPPDGAHAAPFATPASVVACVRHTSRLRPSHADSPLHLAESSSSSCGPRIHLPLLPTPPHGGAVTFGYGPESVCPEGTSTPLMKCARRRTCAESLRLSARGRPTPFRSWRGCASPRPLRRSLNGPLHRAPRREGGAFPHSPAAQPQTAKRTTAGRRTATAQHRDRGGTARARR
jgi:hypothetical protein